MMDTTTDQFDGTVQPYDGPRLFGAPVGDFSLPQTLLFIFSLTVAGLMAGTFFGIVGLGIASAFMQHKPNFAHSYLWVGLPFSALLFISSTAYLGTLLVRRWTRSA